ncbi:hypothetical protein BH20ACT5_BH20ACT5_22980 [soil metagenome]
MATASRIRAGVALATAVAALLRASGPDPAELSQAVADPRGWLGSVGPDAALLTVTVAVCWLVLGWLCLGLGLVAASELPGLAGRIANGLSVIALPAAMRRGVALALGIGIVTTGAMPASAATGNAGQYSASAAQHSALAQVTLTSSVDWPVAPEPDPPAGPTWSPPAAGSPAPSLPASDPRAPGTDASPDPAVVVPGDTLWAIAAESLPAGAGNAQIATSVSSWFLANRAVIGPDPDLIFPGQLLHPPTTGQT